jgi:ABC-2 type transport system permease protein
MTDMQKPAGKLESVKKSYRTRAFRAGGYSFFAGLLVLAIAVAVNLIAAALPNSVMQKDVTGSGLYTLSEQTKRLVTSLDRDVTVYWITQPSAGEDSVEKLLDNYKDLSGRITVKKIDPVEYPNFAKQYTEDKIYNNTLIVVCGDRHRGIGYYDIFQSDYGSGYYGGGYSYEVSFDGEGQLTSAIGYVPSDELPTAYLLSGHGEAELPETLLKQIESENFTVSEDLSLLSLEAAPEDCDLLIINAPQTDLSAEDAEKLSAYLKGGGRLMLATGLLRGGARLERLEGLMAGYGVAQEAGIVIEGDADHTIWSYNYYLLPELDASHDITRPIAEAGYRVLVPAAAGLRAASPPEGVTRDRAADHL